MREFFRWKRLQGVVFWLSLLGLIFFFVITGDDGVDYWHGVVDICIEGDELVAYNWLNRPYAVSDLTTDGTSGTQWTLLAGSVPQKPREYFETNPCTTSPYVEHPAWPDQRYRVDKWPYIEISSDSGTSRKIIYEFPAFGEEARMRMREGWPHFLDDRPHGGIILPETGDVLFAMGPDGVLKFSPRQGAPEIGHVGEWTWIQVGDSLIETMRYLKQLLRLLFYETFLALALLFLVITHASAYVREAYGFHYFMLMVGRWGWVLLIVFLLKPTFGEYAFLDMGIYSCGLTVFIALPLITGALWDILKNYPRRFPTIFLTGLLLAVIYYIPYVLWAFGVITQHRSASLFALMLTAVSAFAAERFLRHHLPVLGQPPRVERQEPLFFTTANYPLDRDLWIEDASDDASGEDGEN